MRARAVQITIDENPACPTCRSPRVIKHGRRYNLHDPFIASQKYRCNKCGTLFSGGRRGYSPRSQFPDRMVDFALRLLAEGLSAREATEETTARFGRRVSSVTVWLWGRRSGVLRPARDLEAGSKVQRVLLKDAKREMDIAAVSRESGVGYNTVKTILRRMDRPPSKVKPEVVRRTARVTYLTRRIEEMRKELSDLIREQSGGEINHGSP